MDFHWSLNDNKSPQVFKALLSILADLNNAMVCIGLIFFFFSNSFNLFSKLLLLLSFYSCWVFHTSIGWMWSYLWNWNRNSWARRHLPASPLTKQTQFEHQHPQKQTPTPTQSSDNLGSCWVSKTPTEDWSNSWHIPLWMLVEFIVCTVIGYNLYKNTACVAHISGSIYLMAQLIFVCQLDASWMI